MSLCMRTFLFLVIPPKQSGKIVNHQVVEAAPWTDLNSKEVFITPEIVEYDGKKTLKKPAFDLIIGTKTMSELGFILDFKEGMITINEIELHMRFIEQLPTSNDKKTKL